jgi:hypothetical protein
MEPIPSYVKIINDYFPNVMCHAQRGRGDNYDDLFHDGGDPIPSQEDLDTLMLIEVKNLQKINTNKQRDYCLFTGWTDSNEITWSTTPVDIMNLNAVCTLIALGVVTKDQVWRDDNNNDHTLSVQQLVELAGALAYFAKLCYAVSWEHKNNIDALTTVEDVLSYDYTTGWPS